jgi:hypothetical protein
MAASRAASYHRPARLGALAGSGAKGHRMDGKLQNEIERLAREFAARVTQLVADAIVGEVQAAMARGGGGAAASAGGEPRRTPRRERRVAAGPVERWVPDRRARRVPKFVIEVTGLEKKADIVERYGEHAIFEKGQPAPPPLEARGAAEA